MKILHASDLHIGKRLINRERSDEYRAVLRELSEICDKEGVELVLIAGDVFDTYTPSAEAEEIFYSGIKPLAKGRAVVIISGNHDDYVRLCAAAQLLKEFNVYVTGNDLEKIDCKRRGTPFPEESGGGWVIFKNDKGERVYINAMPYPNEARFKEGRSDESFPEKMSRWISAGEAGKREGLPSVFLSHIFVAGGKASDSEREIDLGGTRAVPLSLLPDCDYCALGHLHRRQKLGKNAYYCGAPMRFSFDESGQEKSVNVFDLTKNGVENFKRIEITCTRQLVRLQANSVSDGAELLKRYENAFAELTLNIDEPLTAAESAALHSAENLLSLKTNVKNSPLNGEKISNKNKSSSEIFSDYYKSRYSSDVPTELLSLFLSLTEEE